MLSPKMQRTIRVNDSQLVMLSEKAHLDPSKFGYLYKKTADSNKWQARWFILYQNMLFYYDTESCIRPSGVIFLEGCYCERIITTTGCGKKDLHDKQLCFAVSYRRENQRQYELKASSETDCQQWVESIREASFNKLLLQREELEQKHLHLLQIVETEKTAKCTFSDQCDDLTKQLKTLKAEFLAMKKMYKNCHCWTPECSSTKIRKSSLYSINNGETQSTESGPEEDPIRDQKAQKVQSFFRGWLCRRRWKQIVEQYIKSPHAENMKKRNSLIFSMVEQEDDYLRQLDIIVSCFLRPLRMSACSQKPLCTHEDINSIFLNIETILFLHQIFYKGLSTRIESWPTLIFGDLFNMLIPMLGIYQEYVRNHHYSVQVLTECKQMPAFNSFLERLENKPACHSRPLVAFLMNPMHQIPKYIIQLRDLLAHTPHDHVDRKSLSEAAQRLEDLSRQIKDEVSETENLRKNLSIERMIVSGCDILLDVNQVYVREGRLVHYYPEKTIAQRIRLSSTKKPEKISVRYCFLFSNHLILTTRDSNGRLHLVPDIGRISLCDTRLIEDLNGSPAFDGSACKHASNSNTEASGHSKSSDVTDSQSLQSLISCPQHHDFKLVVERKKAPTESIHLYALTMQEKAAWITDISQCLDNVRFSDFVQSDVSSVSMPQSVRNDPKLFEDDVDIRFSRSLNSCKVPRIRYATPERLLERLTDLRFLSIDFLNTFLLTYKVFTNGVTVLEALKKVYYEAEPPESQSAYAASLEQNLQQEGANFLDLDRGPNFSSPRRVSEISSVSGYEEIERERSASGDWSGFPRQLPRHSIIKKEDELGQIKESETESKDQSERKRKVNILIEDTDPNKLSTHLLVSTTGQSSSSETLLAISAPSSPGNVSSTTLVASNGSSTETNSEESPSTLQVSTKDGSLMPQQRSRSPPKRDHITLEATPGTSIPRHLTERGSISSLTPQSSRRQSFMSDISGGAISIGGTSTGGASSCGTTAGGTPGVRRRSIVTSESQDDAWTGDEGVGSACSSRCASIAYPLSFQNFFKQRRSATGGCEDETGMISNIHSQRSSIHHDRKKPASKAGVVITSSRQSKRRSSTSTTATAFAIATSASSNPREPSPQREDEGDDSTSAISGIREKYKRKDSILSTAATMRVLNVLKHWVSKHSQDFSEDEQLTNLTIEFLNDIISAPNLLQAEQKVAKQLLSLLSESQEDAFDFFDRKDTNKKTKFDLNLIHSFPKSPNIPGIEKLGAMEIAEEITFLDHQIFLAIRSQEFLGLAWTKEDREVRAPNITLMTQRFNDGSLLVLSEILKRETVQERASVMEKWIAVAEILKCMKNYNGVLAITSAFSRSPIHRLSKTFEKISKHPLQNLHNLKLIVSADGRFRNMRDAIHRAEPPCIPYLGMYLTDLNFIEEGTPNFTEDGLLNFSKMRMIAHVIREVRCLQETKYTIQHNPRVANYLLNTELMRGTDEQLHNISLTLERRSNRLNSITHLTSGTVPGTPTHT